MIHLEKSDGHRLALATLMTNGHARPGQIHKTLGTAPRSLVRWRKQIDTQGAGSFYQLRVVRGTHCQPRLARVRQTNHPPKPKMRQTIFRTD